MFDIYKSLIKPSYLFRRYLLIKFSLKDIQKCFSHTKKIPSELLLKCRICSNEYN